MKKHFCAFCVTLIFCIGFLFSQEAQNAKLTALEIKNAAFSQGSVKESIDYIRNNLDSAATASDTRSLLYTEGLLLEQLGFYAEAKEAYIKASEISAQNVSGFQKVSSEELLINAVRCSLCAGDFESADFYLSGSLKNSRDSNIVSFVKLYGVWSELCRAQNVKETAPSIKKLESFVSDSSMKNVKASVLLTLWYLTAKNDYALRIAKEFPLSPENGIVKGTVQVMSVPFWYFVPRLDHEANETQETSKQSTLVTSSSKSSQKIIRQQVGFFGQESNAKALITALKKKGFTAYSYTETRPSGKTYFVVVVDENEEGTMGLLLRDSGFECYPVVE